MPQAIPYIVAYGAQAAGATSFWVSVAYIAASVAVADYQRSRAQEAARAAAAAAARDRTITVRSGVAPRKLALGTVRMGGPLMYAEFVGPDEEYLDQIIALTHGELSEVLGVYLDDEWLPASAISGDTPTTGKYSGAEQRANRITKVATLAAESTVTLDDVPNNLTDVHAILNLSGTSIGADASHQPLTISSVVGNVVTLSAPVTGEVWVTYSTDAAPEVPLRVQWAMGSATQPSTTWSGVSTPKWTADHRLRGVSYVRTLMRTENPVYQTGVPQVSLVVRGPKGVWDPRTSTTLSYTSNPALLAAWFRTLPRADGGMGVPSSWVDWASVADAANVCDETISVKKLDGTGYENVKRYECHTVLSLDQPPAENLRIILDSMAGEFPFTAGVYRMFAGAFRPAAITITDDDVAGDAQITFAPAVGADQAPPNIITATIFGANNAWLETGAPAVVNAAYVTADGQEEPLELDLPASTDLRQANYLMGVQLERLRPAMAGSLTLLGKGANLALMDTVQIELTGYEALAGKTFEVRRRTNQWNGRYPLELREVRASTYTLDADRFTAPAVVTPPDTTGLWKPLPVTITGIVPATQAQSDGTRINRALVTWDPHPQSLVSRGGWIELRYRAPATEWTYTAPVPGDQVQAYIGPLGVGTVVFVEARARNGLGAASEWSGFAPFEVLGDTVVPADVTGLAWAIKPGQVQVSWARWSDPTYLETELRVGASWAAGTFLWAGNSTEYHHPRPANGSYTVWAKHRNRSGQVSAAAASVVVTVDDSIDPGGAAAAQLLQLQASGLGYIFESAASTTSTSPEIVFDAVLKNVTGTVTFSATAYDAAGAVVGSVGGVTLTGVTALQARLTAANFAAAGTAVRFVKVSATLGSLSDITTVFRAENGSSAINLVLGNEAHTVPTASDGSAGNYTGATSTVRVYEGLTDVTSLWTLAAAVSNVAGTFGGVAMPNSVSGSGTPSIVVTNLAADTGTVTITATRSGYPTQTKVMSLARSKAGVAGTGFSLSATAQAITFAGDGTTYRPASQTINFTANRAGIGGTVSWAVTAYNASGSAIGNRWPNGQTGDTQTMSESQFTGGGTTTAYVVVTATIGAFSDTVTIVKLADGAASITGYLTNESVTLAADKDGNLTGSISSLTAGVFRVFQGTTEVTASASFSASPTSCTVSGPSAGSGAYNATSMSADNAYAVLTATYGGVSVSRTLSLAKARAGATGATGTGTPGANGASAVYAYQIVNGSTLPSAPAVPSGAPNPGNASTPGLWYSQPPSGSLGTGQWLFQASGTLSGSTYSWISPSYLATFRVGNLSALSAVIDGAQSVSLVDPMSLSGASITFALAANTSNGAAAGVLGQSSTASRPGLYGYNTNTSNGQGVFGYGAIGVLGRPLSGTSGPGVQGEASTASGSAGVKAFSGGLNTYGLYASTPFTGGGTAVYATAASGGTAIEAVGLVRINGTFRIDQTPTTGSAAANNSTGGAALVSKPGSASNNTWLSINLNGSTYYVPVWS